MADIQTEVILTIDTSEFDPNDLMGQAVEMEDVCENNRSALIVSALLLDSDAQGSDLDLLLFRTDPGNLGTVNEPLNLSEAQAAKMLGVIKVEAIDYTEMGSQQIAVSRGVPLLVTADGTSIWIASVARFRSTYPSGGLLVRFRVIQPSEQ